MSHFTVGVFVEKGVKTIEELLAPYQENNMGDCPKEYVEFIECDKSEVERYKEYMDVYESLDHFMDEYYGYMKTEEGKYGYWENPNAKWDWYVVGGRWSNMILTKDGSRGNIAKLKDIDWEGMSKDKRERAKEDWNNTDEVFRFFSGIREGDTLETYVERQSAFGTFAVITPDGEWYSKGETGWFGTSSETEEESNEWGKSYEERFIKNADKEWALVIIDCHI